MVTAPAWWPEVVVKKVSWPVVPVELVVRPSVTVAPALTGLPNGSWSWTAKGPSAGRGAHRLVARDRRGEGELAWPTPQPW